MLFLFSDVGEFDAPTRIKVGSHRDIARSLEPAGEAGLSHGELDRVGAALDRPLAFGDRRGRNGLSVPSVPGPRRANASRLSAAFPGATATPSRRAPQAASGGWQPFACGNRDSAGAPGREELTAMHLVILTGASGSGKTAIAEAIRTGQPDLAEVLHFDSIGVPSPDAMLTWGGGGAWQRAMTLTWMTRIAALRGRRRPVLFEGQMRLAFVREGLLTAGITDARVILVDCDDATRTRRLVTNRAQPELANPDMMAWAEFLRREAKESACEVLDTSRLSLERCVGHVCAYLTPTQHRAELPD
jgi:hypothetical protein